MKERMKEGVEDGREGEKEEGGGLFYIVCLTTKEGKEGRREEEEREGGREVRIAVA